MDSRLDALVQRQVQRLHDSPTMAVVAVTGAGTSALGWLLGEPGASRTILEAVVPYSPPALAAFLGNAPEKVVSVETAGSMAGAAYRRARRFRPERVPVVGIGCTATVRTDRVKRGDHRCYVSTRTEEGTTTYGVTFVKGLRDRSGEDEIVSKLVLKALADACGVEFDLPLLLDDRERLEVSAGGRSNLLDDLLAGRVSLLAVRPDGVMAADEPHRGGVLSGSFDPLHNGHEELARVASQVLNARVVFELSTVNVDKPPLEADEVRRRLAQFAGKHMVLVTRAPTFHDKARLLPGCAFVIGWDTAVRLVDSRYYGGDGHRMLEALEGIRREGCRFLVAGRVEDGVFRSLEDVAIPPGFEDMLAAIPKAAFRWDVSSSELRPAAGGGCDLL